MLWFFIRQSLRDSVRHEVQGGDRAPRARGQEYSASVLGTRHGECSCSLSSIEYFSPSGPSPEESGNKRPSFPKQVSTGGQG